MNKATLKYSKLVRSLQLLELAKSKGRINDGKYNEYQQVIQNKLKTLAPQADVKQASKQEDHESYDILGGLVMKLSIVLVAFLAIMYFVPMLFQLTTPYLVMAIGCPILYLAIVYCFDKYEPEPLVFVAGAFIWGAISTVLALGLNQGTFHLSKDIFGLDIDKSLMISICLAGLTEELVKGFGIYRLAKHYQFNDMMDAIVYGFAIGLGFAAVENVFYYTNFMALESKATYVAGTDIAAAAIIRASLCAIGHGVFTAAVGIMLANSKLQKGIPNIADFIQAYLLAAAIHSLFNTICVFIPKYSVFVNAGIIVVGLYIFWEIIQNHWRRKKRWKPA